MVTYSNKQYPYVNITSIPFDEIERIDLAKCNDPTQTLQTYYKNHKPKPDALMNGGMFVMATGNTIFTLRDEYRTIVLDYNNKEGFGILGLHELAIGSIDDGQAYRDFISAYPTLIQDGHRCDTSKCKSLDYKARRSIVAWDDDCFYLITIDSPGLGFSKIQDILEDMGVVYAANLDGGGSTCKLIEGKKVTTQEYNRPVDNVIAVYLKENKDEDDKQIIYRVQVGAYSIKNNANEMLKKIKQLKGYEDAYVRLVNGLYKVQVGAYSIYDNAKRVEKDLEGKGFNAFVAKYEI